MQNFNMKKSARQATPIFVNATGLSDLTYCRYCFIRVYAARKPC